MSLKGSEKREYTKLDQEQVDAIKKMSLQEYKAQLTLADDEHPFAKMDEEEYSTKYAEEAAKWGAEDPDYKAKIKGKEVKRREFDDLEEKLRLELENLSLVAKKPVEGPEIPTQQATGLGAYITLPSWGKKAEPVDPVKEKHQQLENNKLAVEQKAKLLKLRQTIEGQARDISAEASSSIPLDYTHKSTPVSQESIKAASGALVSQFHAQKSYQKGRFEGIIREGYDLSKEAADEAYKQEAKVRFAKANTPVADSTVYREMKDAKYKAELAKQAEKLERAKVAKLGK